MGRASRSNKKQPAFDPSELADLIFSPAVGRGVGSHLLEQSGAFPAPVASGIESGPSNPAVTMPRWMSDSATEIVHVHLTTEGNTGPTAVVESSTLDRSRGMKDYSPGQSAVGWESEKSQLGMSTVADADMSILVVSPTVDMSARLGDGSQGQQKQSTLRSSGSILRDSDRQEFLPGADLATVPGSLLSTVPKSPIGGPISKPPTIDSYSDLSTDSRLTATEVMPVLPTVADMSRSTVDMLESDLDWSSGVHPSEKEEAIVEGNRSSQGPSIDLPTVDKISSVPVDSPGAFVAQGKTELHTPRSKALWITEQGDLVPEARVRRIRLAQDVINSAEESVYDTLWTVKTVQTEDRESFRVVQAGYDYLAKRTRLSKKTIQRIVAKLIDKDFIAIERPADIYQRTSTIYRVLCYKAVLERHFQRGRFYVAKMGPGFSYVRSMQDPRTIGGAVSKAPQTERSDMTRVDMTGLSTVVNQDTYTGGRQTTVTVANDDQSTVVPQTTTYIDRNTKGSDTQSSSTVYAALAQFGIVDDDILTRLIENCRRQAPDCTEEEVVHFIQEKGLLVRGKDSKVYNPVGFLLTAVPNCFTGEAFRFYREQQEKRFQELALKEATQQAELDRWRLEQEGKLSDTSVPEEEKQFIREYLGIKPQEVH